MKPGLAGAEFRLSEAPTLHKTKRAKTMRTTYELHGYLTGTLWQGCEAYKNLNLKFVRNETDRPSPWIDAHETLRDAMLAATSDGDFQSCKVADGFLRCKTRSRLGYIVHVRTYELSRFPSVADMVNEKGCGPEGRNEFRPVAGAATARSPYRLPERGNQPHFSIRRKNSASWRCS